MRWRMKNGRNAARTGSIGLRLNVNLRNFGWAEENNRQNATPKRSSGHRCNLEQRLFQPIWLAKNVLNDATQLVQAVQVGSLLEIQAAPQSVGGCPGGWGRRGSPQRHWHSRQPRR